METLLKVAPGEEYFVVQILYVSDIVAYLNNTIGIIALKHKWVIII